MKLTDENGKEYKFTESQGTLNMGWLEPVKPELKKIDMSRCIESGIDMEFDLSGSTPIRISKLSSIDSSAFPFNFDSDDSCSETCRPRMNHIHACIDGFDKCPLPDGFKIKVYLRDGDTIGNDEITSWIHHGFAGDIIAFEVTGIADGWEL